MAQKARANAKAKAVARRKKRDSEKETFKELPGKRDPFKVKQWKTTAGGRSSGGTTRKREMSMDERMDALERKILGHDPVEKRKKERAKRVKERPVDLPSATNRRDRKPGPDIPLGKAVWKGLTTLGKPYTQTKPYKKKKK